MEKNGHQQHKNEIKTICKLPNFKTAETRRDEARRGEASGATCRQRDGRLVFSFQLTRRFLDVVATGLCAQSKAARPAPNEAEASARCI